MAHDAKLALTNGSVTSTTAYTGTFLNLQTTPGTPLRGMTAKIDVSNFSAATAGAIYTPVVYSSPDQTAVYVVATGTPLTCTTSAQAGAEQSLRFDTRQGDQYVALGWLLSPSTGSPTISFQGWVDF